MDWKRLMPTSLLFAALVVGGGVLTMPADATQAQECKKQAGDDCESICEEECTDGSCCHWRHYNYPSDPV